MKSICFSGFYDTICSQILILLNPNGLKVSCVNIPPPPAFERLGWDKNRFPFNLLNNCLEMFNFVSVRPVM